MPHADVQGAKTRLLDLVEAAMSGIEVVITQDNRPVVKLVTLARSKPNPRLGVPQG